MKVQLHCAAEFKKKLSHCIVVAVVSSQVCFISDKWLFFGRLIFRDCVWNCAQSSCHFPYLFIVFLLQSVAADLSYLQHRTATGCTFSPPLHLLILIQLPSPISSIFSLPLCFNPLPTSVPPPSQQLCFHSQPMRNICSRFRCR